MATFSMAHTATVLSKMKKVVSTDKSRPNLHPIFYEPRLGRFTATNGNIIFIFTDDGSVGISKESMATMHRCKVLEDPSGDGILMFFKDIPRNDDGFRYPNYRHILPSSKGAPSTDSLKPLPETGAVFSPFGEIALLDCIKAVERTRTGGRCLADYGLMGLGRTGMHICAGASWVAAIMPIIPDCDEPDKENIVKMLDLAQDRYLRGHESLAEDLCDNGDG